MSLLKVYFIHIQGCIGCCCPAIGNYLVADKIGADEMTKYIGFLDFCGGGVIFSMLGQMLIRGKIRERDNIEGSPIGDCFAACCCLECSICQTYNHVK